MTGRTWIGLFNCLAFLVIFFTSNAQASVIGYTPSANFSKSSYSIDIGTAGYTFTKFSYNPSAGKIGDFSPGIKTRGTGLVSSSPVVANTVNSYLVGTSIDDNMIFGGPFTAFKNVAQITTDQNFAFLALKLFLNDGAHFGYAKLDGFTLDKLAYESAVNQPIKAGQALDKTLPSERIHSVRAPNSINLFFFSLILIGFVPLLKKMARVFEKATRKLLAFRRQLLFA